MLVIVNFCPDLKEPEPAFHSYRYLYGGRGSDRRLSISSARVGPRTSSTATHPVLGSPGSRASRPRGGGAGGAESGRRLTGLSRAGARAATGGSSAASASRRRSRRAAAGSRYPLRAPRRRPTGRSTPGPRGLADVGRGVRWREPGPPSAEGLSSAAAADTFTGGGA